MMNSLKAELLRKCTDLTLDNEELRAQCSSLREQLSEENERRKRFQHHAACLDAENEDLLKRCLARSRSQIELPTDVDTIAEDVKDASAKWSLIDQKEAELQRVLKLMAMQEAEKKLMERENHNLIGTIEKEKERSLDAQVCVHFACSFPRSTLEHLCISYCKPPNRMHVLWQSKMCGRQCRKQSDRPSRCKKKNLASIKVLGRRKGGR